VEFKMKLKCFFTGVFFLSAAVYAQNDKNCEAAVDAAASMNMNQSECDYSNKGLNGFLQKAFKKGEEGATLETSNNTEKANNNNIQEAEKKSDKSKLEKTSAKNFILNAETIQWADLTVLRTQLLSKAMEKCGTSFTVAGETYRLLTGGKLELAMRFECISG
jgi:hypothetical protein